MKCSRNIKLMQLSIMFFQELCSHSSQSSTAQAYIGYRVFFLYRSSIDQLQEL